MITLLAILAFLLVAAIFVAGFVQNHQAVWQQRDRERGLLEKKLAGLEQLFATLLKADHDNAVVRHLNLEAISQLQRIAALARKPASYQPQLDALQARQRALDAGELSAGGQLAAGSDAELEALHRCFSEAHQQLQRLRGRGRLSSTEFEQLSQHLYRLTLESEVESHLQLGRLHLQDGNRSKALQHLKTARLTLKKSNLKIPERTARLTAMTEEIAAIEKPPSADQPADPTDVLTSDAPRPS